MKRTLILTLKALTLATVLASCGKAGGKIGKLGLEGIGADHRCIPSKVSFGKTERLSAAERAQFYEFVRDLSYFNQQAHMTITLAAQPDYNIPGFQFFDRLRPAYQDGRCQVKAPGVFDGVVQQGSVTGSQCPMMYQNTSGEAQGYGNRPNAVFKAKGNSARVNDETWLRGKVRGVVTNEELLLDQFESKPAPAMHMTNCHVKVGKLETTNQGPIAVYETFESLASWNRFDDPNGINEYVKRTGFRFADYVVELKEVLSGLDGQPNIVFTQSLNGEPVVREEVEAVGIRPNDLGLGITYDGAN